MSDTDVVFWAWFWAARLYPVLRRVMLQSYPESVLPNGTAVAASTITLQVPKPEPTIHWPSTLH